MRIPITPEENALIDKPINSRGGFQDLMKRLQAGRKNQNTELEISREDAERIRRYATNYGDGGYERRLGSLVPKVAAWLQENPEPTLNFDAEE